MSQESELVRLEKFIAKLLEKFSLLQEENGRLNQELKLREETIVGLKDQIEDSDLERIEISDRVNSIIGKIEDWETNLGEEGAYDEVPINDPSRQGSLFAVEGQEGSTEEARGEE